MATKSVSAFVERQFAARKAYFLLLFALPAAAACSAPTIASIQDHVTECAESVGKQKRLAGDRAKQTLNYVIDFA